MEFEALEREGWWHWPQAVENSSLAALEAALPWITTPSRRPVPLAPLNAWLAATDLATRMGECLGPGSRVVRALLMAKGEGQAWDIGWHRDTTFAVKTPKAVVGFDGWVDKGPFWQVQAPLDFVAKVRSLRLHLDDSGSDTGPLLVKPGSHRGEERDPVALHAQRGDAILMNPLLLHASERPRTRAPRRVLHLEWADFDLPGGLEWAWF
ncbi:MAG: phytanoyl-CoA dioxygenase family protein [Acidobacteria bacterium]|nr:phytanoyl-CoA dioxygenase family protein [Acidobacteriota bacterium]